MIKPEGLIVCYTKGLNRSIGQGTSFFQTEGELIGQVGEVIPRLIFPPPGTRPHSAKQSRCNYPPHHKQNVNAIYDTESVLG